MPKKKQTEKPEEPTKEEIDKIENRTYPKLPFVEEIIIERPKPEPLPIIPQIPLQSPINTNPPEFYNPIFNKPIQQNNPAIAKPKDISQTLLKIGGSIAIAIMLVGVLYFVYAFSEKEFGSNINVTNEVPSPDVNINSTNAYNHTIVNNQTINIYLEGEIAKMIANQTIFEVKKQLNTTNSS